MHDLGPAARELARVAAHVDEAALERPTPCAAWTVRDLLIHVLGLTAHFAGVARKEVPPGEPGEDLPDGWRELLDARLVDLAAAWRDPSAWTGEGEAGGVRMPNAELGVVALEEVVLHGWDLARAVDAPFAVSDADLAAVRGFVEGVEDASEQERAGLYGRVVAVEEGTSELDRVLALAGRDPRRTADVAG